MTDHKPLVRWEPASGSFASVAGADAAEFLWWKQPFQFDPEAVVDVHIFDGVIARCWRNPPEGLGFDNSPSAHMWRSIIWPNNFL